MDTCILEVGPEVESGSPPICLIAAVYAATWQLQSLVLVGVLVRGSHEDMQDLLYLHLEASLAYPHGSLASVSQLG